MYFGNATASYGPSVIATIHLSTPYVNVISMGPTLTTAVSTEGEFVSAMRKRAQAEAPSPTALIGSSKSDFGYVLPFFIKFLANQSKYAAQYPQIASCLPVEPSIDPSLKQIALASNPDIDSDLFSIITSITHPDGCLVPDSIKCATGLPPPPPSITPLLEVPSHPITTTSSSLTCRQSARAASKSSGSIESAPATGLQP
ncbi:hypothetical protein ABVK25_003470 [Lepraria finkii]|uniref:Uncharacterized protein n=1 Tax=Lepraria finkii TaxID=1340010 RepID=A0ABR4BHY5_9LECA